MFGWLKKKRPESAKPDHSTLVPRIKNLQFTSALNGMNVPADQLPYTEPLAADLLVTYAFDLPGLFRMASGADIAEAGIRPEDARQVAVANLKRQLPQIGVADHGPVQRIATGGDLEACTLLAGPFWDQVAQNIQGEVVAAVPSRNVVLFCGNNSAEAIATLRLVCEQIFEEAATHALTKRLLVWQPGQWAEYAA